MHQNRAYNTTVTLREPGSQTTYLAIICRGAHRLLLALLLLLCLLIVLLALFHLLHGRNAVLKLLLALVQQQSAEVHRLRVGGRVPCGELR